MLEAKAAGLPMPAQPQQPAAPPEPPMDPAIAAAIAKARAAAMATCSDSGGGGQAPGALNINNAAQAAIAKANATLLASSSVMGETSGLLNTMQMMTGAARPTLPVGLGGVGGYQAPTMIRPTLSPMGQMGGMGQLGQMNQMGMGQVILPKAQMGMMGGGLRPTIRPAGLMGMGGMGGVPQVVPPPPKMQAMPGVGLGGAAAMSKSGATVAPVGLAGMKEVSPALAALMGTLG